MKETILILLTCIFGSLAITTTTVFLKNHWDKRKERLEKNKKEEAWLDYCEELDHWFWENRRAFRRSSLNRRQEKILFALAEHSSNHSARLKLWQILMLWDWDGTDIDRLRFYVDLEILTDRELLGRSGGCDHIAKDYQSWFLTNIGRDYLLNHGFI